MGYIVTIVKYFTIDYGAGIIITYYLVYSPFVIHSYLLNLAFFTSHFNSFLSLGILDYIYLIIF